MSTLTTGSPIFTFDVPNPEDPNNIEILRRIKEGKRRYVRSGHPDKYPVGMVIEVEHANGKFKVVIVGTKHYETLYDLAADVDPETIVPGAKTLAEVIAFYRQWYTDEIIAKNGGLNALTVEPLSEDN